MSSPTAISSRTGTVIRRTVIRSAAALLAVAAALSAAVFANGDVGEALGERRLARLNALVKSVYNADYQQMADENLAKRRGSSSHGLDDIFTAANPYGTNTTSLYTYFTTQRAAKVTYTVHAEGYPDFTRDAWQDKTYQTTHEFTVIGLIPGVRNTITYTVTYEDGTSDTRTISRTGPSLYGVEEIKLEQTKTASEGTDLGDGLYVILGNDSDEQDFMYYYDTNGVLRGEIPLLYYRSHRLLFDDDGLMWFSASTKTFVGMNRLGKLEKIIDLGDRFILHHDYALDGDGDIVSLATDLKRSDHAVQDQIIKVDTDSGKVTLLADFGDLLPDYKSATTRSGIDESDPTASGRWDWIHFNTIQLLDDGSALLSARETSTIIKVDDLESNPTIAYMIGEPSVWDGTGYQNLFLTKVGNFGDTGGQHSITYVDDPSLPDGQYYLYMFDNNFGYAMTRPDYDWTTIDGISTAQSSKDKDSRSQYRRYLIDENAGTYTEVASFDVPYSPYVSSAQELDDGDILIDTGMQGLFGVYSADGTLLAQYRMKLSTSYIYRVYSYDLEGFYFAA